MQRQSGPEFDPEEQCLAEALRREAETAAPAFSPELHRRIVAGLVPRKPRRWHCPVGLAAAALLAVGVWEWTSKTAAPMAESRVPSVARLPERMAEGVGRALDVPQGAGHASHLDYDVARLGRFVLRHVSSVPGRNGGPPPETPG